jgi:hypothetical protein
LISSPDCHTRATAFRHIDVARRRRRRAAASATPAFLPPLSVRRQRCRRRAACQRRCLSFAAKIAVGRFSLRFRAIFAELSAAAFLFDAVFAVYAADITPLLAFRLIFRFLSPITAYASFRYYYAIADIAAMPLTLFIFFIHAGLLPLSPFQSRQITGCHYITGY